jgi:hypothetical protein
MLDAFAILVSCGACLFVAWRALKLDNEIPWYGSPPKPSEPRRRQARRPPVRR